MSKTLLALPVIFVMTIPSLTFAKEVHLKKGETYRDQDLTVICEGGGPDFNDQPLAIQECQYWDGYDKKCLFNKTTYMINDLLCVEECQHWNSYAKSCDYQKKCTFHPGQEVFVLSTCTDFDSFNHKCLKSSDELIKK